MSFDLRNLKWSDAAQHLGTPLNTAFLNPCDTNIVRRIGSPSANGEVYEVQWPFENEGALKIMPCGSDSDNEVRVATELSDLVRAGTCFRFPIVYGSTICQETRVEKDSILGKCVREKHLRQLLRAAATRGLDASDPRARRIERIYAKASLAELSRGVDDEILKSIMTDEGPFLTRVLVSELCYSDVNFFIRNGRVKDEGFFGDIVAQCFQCIREMLRVGIAHKDIHFGNFLVRYATPSSAPFVLIHDFGTSERTDRYQDYVWDAEKLLDAVLHTGQFIDLVKMGCDVFGSVSCMKETDEALAYMASIFASRSGR